MTDAPNLYQKARSDVCGMLGYDLDNLSAEQSVRLDVATALRVLLDTQTGRMLRGESLDARELLMASDALSKILPPLREPPSESREDPREIMWRIYSEMRSRGELNLRPLAPDELMQAKITQLESENAQLRAALGGSTTAIDPPTSDVVPACEWRGETHAGIGPNDPKPPVTIEATPVPPAAAAPAPRPRNWDATPGGRAWRAWHDAGGSVGGDRWSNRNIP